MKKIKKDDQVKVIVGKYKGKISTVIKVFRDKEYVVVKDVNLFKKSQKPRSGNEKGKIIEITKPIHISNVQLVDKQEKTFRSGFKFEKDNKKIRYNKKTQVKI